MRFEAESERKLKPSRQLLQHLQQAILFENDHVLVLNKPSGLAVHAGSGLDFGVIDAMRLLRSNDDIELLHRLDRDTSGCLMLTKHRQALLAMQASLQDKSLGKNYRALVKGRWPAELIEVDLALKKIYLPNGERRVSVDSHGKSALSRFTLLHSEELFSIVQVELVTGRTHQIRVHCQAQGHEIAGDDKYGDAEFNRSMRKRGISRLMLHASSLDLPPGKYTPELMINAPLPAEFELLSAKTLVN